MPHSSHSLLPASGKFILGSRFRVSTLCSCSMSDSPPLSGRTSQPSGFGSKHLEHFRSDRRRLPLHPREKALLALVALHLCFLPWALGTMHVWSQLTSLGLGAAGMVLALIPRTYSGDYALPMSHQVSGLFASVSQSENRGQTPGWQLSRHAGGATDPGLAAASNREPATASSQASGQATTMRLTMWPRLLRFPLFWIGLALLRSAVSATLA